MARSYRSPTGGSAAAAIAPSRLAQDVDGRALWREQPDGQLEVALLRGRTLERYIVDADGRATLAVTSPATWSERWAGRVAIGGWLLGLATIVVGGITHPGGSDVGVGIVAAFFTALPSSGSEGS